MPNKTKQKKRKVKAYVKYSSLAYQLFGLIAMCIFIGLKADKHFGNETQYITVALLLITLFGYFYKLIIDLKEE